jgi:hypothetical protein
MLWAGSPMDKAGTKLGEILWSLDKNTDNQQHKADLEAGLQNLTPGPHTFYKTTPALWQKGLDDVRNNPSDNFNPARIKTTLTAF